MADVNHDDDGSGNRLDVKAARRYTIWMILWILIALALLTWIFAFTYGEQDAPAVEALATGSIIAAAARPLKCLNT